MNHYTREDIMRLVEEEDVEFIRLQFTDVFGVMKNIAITASQLKKALDNRFLFDASTLNGFVRVEEPDLCLHPDLDTFVIFPWRPQQGKVARLICGLYDLNGNPYQGDARYILRREIEKAKEKGFEFKVGPECEFFLFDIDENGDPTTVTREKAGYFDLGPTDSGENIRRDMVLTLEEMGYIIEESYHEIASGQHQINFKYADALETADNIMTFKLAIKTIAKRHGYFATFMPKPKYGVHGSGMHLNFSLFRDGVNLFADETDEIGLSQEAYYFLGGLMRHIKALTAINNPTVNSYKRLVHGYEAPVSIAWSTTNRTSLIRVPVERGKHTRLNLQSPDASCNPYLCLAACLAAGMDGIQNNMMPPKRVDVNLYEMTKAQLYEAGIERLPKNLHEAMKELEADSFVKNTLGEHIHKKLIASKEEEWEEYCAQVSDWELQRYLYKI